MTATATPTRDDLPEPKFEVLKKTLEQKSEKSAVHQWLVKTRDKHLVRIIPAEPVENGKVKPVQYGAADHVLVTTRYEDHGERGVFAETSVYGSNADGDFYNAPLYVTPGVREVWEAMYAIGEM